MNQPALHAQPLPYGLTHEERVLIKSLPKVQAMCPKLQEAKDKTLKAELLADLGLLYSEIECPVIVDRVMAVIKAQR